MVSALKRMNRCTSDEYTHLRAMECLLVPDTLFLTRKLVSLQEWS